MGVLREQFFVQLIHTDSKDNQPFFTFLQYYYLPMTDIDNLCERLFDIDCNILWKMHKYDKGEFATQHRWLLKNQEIPKHITYFIKECKKHKALPQYKLSFGGYKDNYVLLELDDKSFTADDIPTLYEDFKNWLSNIPQSIYDMILTDNYKKVFHNAWERQQVFYVYILLNSDELVGYYQYYWMNIDKYNNLRHSGNCLDIRICAIDKNFNAVGVYGCNVKDTIIKNCRTWLYDAECKGLI